MKTLFALDPFHLKQRQLRAAYRFVSELTGSKPIEFGFIVTQTEPDLALAFDVPREKRFTTYPKSLVEKLLRRAGIKNETVHIVTHPTFSLTSTARRFFQLAEDRKTDLSVVFSQGGNELRKLFVGSFAETSVHIADRNLLVINPHSKLPKKVRTVLLAYEPDGGKNDPLGAAIDLCRRTASKLVVFHAARFTYGIAEEDSTPEMKSYKRKIDRLKTEIERRCKKGKVDVETVISTEFAMVSELIDRQAKKQNADLVVVVAKSGRGTALMGGSITRQVLRRCKSPVLVMRC